LLKRLGIKLAEWKKKIGEGVVHDRLMETPFSLKGKKGFGA